LSIGVRRLSVGPSGNSWGIDGPSASGDIAVDDVPVAPPNVLLFAACATALGSLLLWVPGGIPAHLAGYVLSTFVTLGLLAGFKRQDLRARQSAFYSPRSQLNQLAVGVAVLAVAGAGTHVWVIATFWTA
jgi:hypothetical protein